MPTESAPANMISHSTSPLGPSGRNRFTSPIIWHDLMRSGVKRRSSPVASGASRARRMKVSSEERQSVQVPDHLLSSSSCHFSAISISLVGSLMVQTHSAFLVPPRCSAALTLSTPRALATSSTRGIAGRDVSGQAESSSCPTSTCSGLVRIRIRDMHAPTCTEPRRPSRRRSQCSHSCACWRSDGAMEMSLCLCIGCPDINRS